MHISLPPLTVGEQPKKYVTWSEFIDVVKASGITLSDIKLADVIGLIRSDAAKHSGLSEDEVHILLLVDELSRVATDPNKMKEECGEVLGAIGEQLTNDVRFRAVVTSLEIEQFGLLTKRTITWINAPLLSVNASIDLIMNGKHKKNARFAGT